MPFHAPGDFKELILAYGGPGSGKTTAWMGIADLSLKTKSDAHFWVIDNDNSTIKAITNPTGSFHNLTANTTIWRPKSFDEYEAINDTILSEAKPNDWVIVDMLSNVWEGMPDWWHQNVFGESPWDYWKSVRKEILSGEKDRSFGGDSGVDWQYIGKVYRAWEKALTMNPPCNFFGTGPNACSAPKSVIPRCKAIEQHRK
jgi:hypothetical protein